jgi:hypothetical protein
MPYLEIRKPQGFRSIFLEKPSISALKITTPACTAQANTGYQPKCPASRTKKIVNRERTKPYPFEIQWMRIHPLLTKINLQLR